MKSGTEHPGLDYMLSNESSGDIQKTYSGKGDPKSEYEGSQRKLYFSEDGSEAYKLGVHDFTSIILGQALHTLGFPVMPEFPIKSMQGNKKRPGKRNWNQIINEKNSNDLGGGVVYQQRISPLEDRLKLHKLPQEELEETYGISSLDEKAFIPIPVEFGYNPESLDDISKHFFEYDKQSRIARAERIVDVFSGLNPVDALFGELRIQNCGTDDGELRVFDFGSELGREPHRMHPIKYDNDGTPLRGSDGGYILDLESDTPEAKDARLWYFKMMNLGWISRGEIRNVHEAVNGIDVEQFSLAFENQEIEGKINDFKDSHSEHLKILKYFGSKFDDELKQKLVNQLGRDGYYPIITVPDAQKYAEGVKQQGARLNSQIILSHEDESRLLPEFIGAVMWNDVNHIVKKDSSLDLLHHLLSIREAHLPNTFYWYDDGPYAVRLLSDIATTLENPNLDLFGQKENVADRYIFDLFAQACLESNLDGTVINLEKKRKNIIGDIFKIYFKNPWSLDLAEHIEELTDVDNAICELMTGSYKNFGLDLKAERYEDNVLRKFDTYEEMLKEPHFEQGICSQEYHHNFDDDETRKKRKKVLRIKSDKDPKAVKKILSRN